uniref:Uncharacterized protein n=1 Tax=Physcomitrium patens TaxID=3218 RepID=A0A2K1JC44_PHYPA|nr:hypothetical protein PHYPA_019356 [Physcomitrium patens]
MQSQDDFAFQLLQKLCGLFTEVEEKSADELSDTVAADTEEIVTKQSRVAGSICSCDMVRQGES